MHLTIREVDGYIEESSGNKYLIFASTDKNNEVLKKYAELWDGIKNLIEKINGRPGGHKKDFIKIKFSSDNNLPLNKILKLHMLTIIFKFVFQEDSKYYPQVFLHKSLYVRV